MTNEELNKAATRLLDNKDFQDVILNEFIKLGVLEHSLQHNIRSEVVLDEVIARRILHEWFFGIITTGENLKTS